MSNNECDKKEIPRQGLTVFVIMFVVVTVMFLIPIAANAQTITMSNPSGVSERDILVYFANGSMQGMYNSTSVISLDGTQDYIFAQKPLRTNPLEDPGDWLANEAFPFVQSNLIPLLAIVFLAAVWFGRRR